MTSPTDGAGSADSAGITAADVERPAERPVVPRRVAPRRRPAPETPTSPTIPTPSSSPAAAPMEPAAPSSPSARVAARPVVVPRRRPDPALAPAPAPAPSPAPAPAEPAAATSTQPESPAGTGTHRGAVSSGHRFTTTHHSIGEPHSIAPGRVTPPERLDPENAWKFADLGSACPTLGLDAANRLDPYWDGLWGAGSGASWLSADLARRQTAAGLGRLPAELDLSVEQAQEVIESSRGWADRLAMLGALFSWRTMTVEQMAAFVGQARLASTLDPSPAALFASGVLDLGVFSNGLHNTDLTGRGAVYRTGKGNAFDTLVKDRLSWPEWISVTGGQRWSPSTNYDRHNILGTELALRLAEFTDVGTVLGERFSSLDMLVGSGLGKASLSHDQRAADLCAVRSDGMRVVFEMTANTGTHFYNKVSRWARLLAENPLETSGLCVVFVIIQHPERLAERNGYIPRATTYQAIAAATKEFPGSARDRVAERMGVATWREWFPDRGLVHDAFFTLRADRPTGRGADLWEPCDFLDPNPTAAASADVAGRPFTPRDPAAMTAVLDNAALLGNTPHWLRERRDPPTLWPHLLANAGVERIPVPTPARPNRTKGRALGEAVGAAGPAKPPARLLGLPRPTGRR